jgi:23S rRNA (cytidine1920-2'-O)/16S rRNA (cytidine1409-2'-O)-methyltransferase
VRADLTLVAMGLAASRTQARALIEAGAVQLRTASGFETLRKPSAEIAHDTEIVIDERARPRYVSRGGLKLEGALAAAGIDPRGMVCLDLGQSTGGFTDCLLQAGAARVVGIDVGHGQLHPSLGGDHRVLAFEGINVRALATPEGGSPPAFSAAVPPGGFDLVVADLSFISLAHALAPAAALLRPGGTLLALVKPQFEVGRGGVDSRGIVRDERSYAVIRERIEQAARHAGLAPRGWHESPIRGGDGNREFFLHAVK